MGILPVDLGEMVNELPRFSRVLLIDQHTEDLEAMQQTINAHFAGQVVRSARRVSEALADGLEDVDLVIAATDLPDLPGIGVLEEVFLLRPDMPVLLTAPENDPGLAVKAIREGAYDYLVKQPGYLAMIPMVIEKNLALHLVNKEHARLQVQLTSTLAQLRAKNGQLQNLVKELETIAATDSLTGLANRRAFSAALDQRYAYAVRNNSDVALITIDLDGFKQLNDAAGHPAGDRVLMLVSRVLRANCRTSDVPGRVGGDEFVVLLPETDLDEAVAVAERIQEDFGDASEAICRTLQYQGAVSMSLGLVTRKHAPQHTATAEGFFNLADKALYRAKAEGKSRLKIFTPAQD
ncbi:MAG: diguanylate cyclase [Planctomycetota bacterium]